MASNLERRSASRRLGVTPTGGRLTGVGRIRCSGPQFSMRFSPTALERRGEPTSLTLGGRRATMAAGVGRAARRKLSVDGDGL
jgi:hypothetical protein